MRKGEKNVTCESGYHRYIREMWKKDGGRRWRQCAKAVAMVSVRKHYWVKISKNNKKGGM